jgi:N-acylglucosamine 2-epimerase
MNPERREKLLTIYGGGLFEDNLGFWFPRCVDKQYGGFLVARDRNGSLLDSDKSVWQQGRATWLLGELFNTVDRREDWLEYAGSGINFIDRFCFDPTDGRMWFHVTREGRPIRKRRYAFSESFACIAYGEYARATESDEYAEKARQVFLRFIDHNLNPQGVEPKFTDVRPMKGIGFPMIAIFAAQELRNSIKLDIADGWIERFIEEIKNDFMKPDIQCVMETVSPRGEILDHFEARTLNPGHAIEGAWFIMQEGQLRGDTQLIEMGRMMLDWMWERGWDRRYGGILYFRDVYGKPVQEYWQDMKFWWPQCEAIIATLLAYQLTGDEKYARWHKSIHDWAYQYFPDPEYGEWFGYLHRDGTPSVKLKGNMWKGPFHIPRMQLTCWRILQEMRQTGG